MNKKDRYFSLITERPTAWLGHGNFAINLVELINPTIIVDLGVDCGYSTFSWAYPNIGRVYGIDNYRNDQHAENSDACEYVLRKKTELENEFNVSNIEIIISDFTTISQTWNKKIDILHIDGDHSYKSVSEDFYNFSKFVPENGVIVFHDTISYKNDVGRFFDELGGYKFNRENWYGLGVYTRSKETYEKIASIIHT